jgi:hypothetical protein
MAKIIPPKLLMRNLAIYFKGLRQTPDTTKTIKIPNKYPTIVAKFVSTTLPPQKNVFSKLY